MSEMLTAHAAKHAFLRDEGTVSPNLKRAGRSATDEQSVRTIPKKHGHKQNLDSVSQCNSSTVFDLVVLEIHNSLCRSGLLVVAARCRVHTTRKVALPEKSNMLTERVKRRALRWWRIKLGTLNAETATSQDLCQPLSCRVVPSQDVSHCTSLFPFHVLSCARTIVAYACNVTSPITELKIKWKRQIREPVEPGFLTHQPLSVVSSLISTLLSAWSWMLLSVWRNVLSRRLANSTSHKRNWGMKLVSKKKFFSCIAADADHAVLIRTGGDSFGGREDRVCFWQDGWSCVLAKVRWSMCCCAAARVPRVAALPNEGDKR